MCIRASGRDSREVVHEIIHGHHLPVRERSARIRRTFYPLEVGLASMPAHNNHGSESAEACLPRGVQFRRHRIPPEAVSTEVQGLYRPTDVCQSIWCTSFTPVPRIRGGRAIPPASGSGWEAGHGGSEPRWWAVCQASGWPFRPDQDPQSPDRFQMNDCMTSEVSRSCPRLLVHIMRDPHQRRCCVSHIEWRYPCLVLKWPH